MAKNITAHGVSFLPKAYRIQPHSVMAARYGGGKTGESLRYHCFQWV